MQQLRTLSVVLDRLTSSLPAALNSLRELRSLSITLGVHTPQGYVTADDDDSRLVDECLAAIGQMTRLEALSLSAPLRGESLAHLSKIKGLKSLRLDFWVGDWNGSEHRKPDPEGCLRVVGALTQLEWLSLQVLGRPQELRVPNESLAYLAGLSELHTLSLGLATDDHPMLSHLPPLPRLEALDLSGSPVNDEDLRRLPVLPRLKLFSLGSSGAQSDAFTVHSRDSRNWRPRSRWKRCGSMANRPSTCWHCSRSSVSRGCTWVAIRWGLAIVAPRVLYTTISSR